MLVKHKVRINVSSPDYKGRVLETGELTLPRKIARALFGEGTKILVMTPGATVSGVEIVETPADGGSDSSCEESCGRPGSREESPR